VPEALKLEARVVALRLPRKKWKERLAALRKELGRKVTKREEAQAKWNLIVTNLTDFQASADTLAKLYAVRWQIEILFKALKGGLSVDKIRAASCVAVVKAYIWALLAISVAVASVKPLTLWLLALILIAEPAHFLIELPEHIFCDNASRSPFRNTRTIVASPFAVWFTNYNNFHVEHHLRPSLPFDQLPALHRSIRVQLRHFDQGYPTFFLGAFATSARRAAHDKEERSVR
jgi:fatty acid desaturase